MLLTYDITTKQVNRLPTQKAEPSPTKAKILSQKGDVLNGIKLNKIQKSCLEFKAAFLILLICYIVFFKVIQDLNPNPV